MADRDFADNERGRDPGVGPSSSAIRDDTPAPFVPSSQASATPRPPIPDLVDLLASLIEPGDSDTWCYENLLETPLLGCLPRPHAYSNKGSEEDEDEWVEWTLPPLALRALKYNRRRAAGAMTRFKHFELNLQVSPISIARDRRHTDQHDSSATLAPMEMPSGGRCRKHVRKRLQNA